MVDPPRRFGQPCIPANMFAEVSWRGNHEARQNAELADFIREHLDGNDIYEVAVQATPEHLEIAPQGLIPGQLGVWNRK